MPLESADTIAELNAAWPLGTDPKSEGDDHLRLIKDVLQKDAIAQAIFDALEARVAVNETDIGERVLKAGDTMTGPLVVPDATEDEHAVNRQTGDARYLTAAAALPEIWGIVLDGSNTPDTLTKGCTIVRVSNGEYDMIFDEPLDDLLKWQLVLTGDTGAFHTVSINQSSVNSFRISTSNSGGSSNYRWRAHLVRLSD